MTAFSKGTAYYNGKEISAAYHNSKRIDYEFQNGKQIYSWYYPKGMNIPASKVDPNGKYYQKENDFEFKYAPYAYLVNSNEHRYVDFNYSRLADVSEIEVTGLSLQASSHWGTGTNPTEIDSHTWYTYRCKFVPLLIGKYNRTVIYQYKNISKSRIEGWDGKTIFDGQCNQVGGIDSYALDAFNSNGEKMNSQNISVRLVGFDTGVGFTLEYSYKEDPSDIYSKNLYDYLTVTNMKILSNYKPYEQ